MPSVEPAPTVVVLAAGRGTRMRSATPKMLHDLCGRPLVAWALDAATGAGAHRVIVVDQPGTPLAAHLPGDHATVEQIVDEHGDGTAGAVVAASHLLSADRPVVVLNGDAPLVTAEVVHCLVEAHLRHGNAATVLSADLDDPSGFGRVVRGDDGAVERVVETKAPGDATAAELAIREVNAGVYCFDGRRLLDVLPTVGTENAQGERYLPDVLGLLRDAGDRVGAYRARRSEVVLGVNDRAQLAAVREVVQAAIHRTHHEAGVTIVSPASTTIDVGVAIGPDTTVEPGSVLRGTTIVGRDCVVGPHAVLTDATIGDGVTVVQSHVVGAVAHDDVTIGPFAYLRPGTVLRAGSKAGTFVELKNTDVGEGAKVPHLSYVGDADVGPRSNLGASTITANYDGRNKHRTTFGADVHGSVHTSYVAPVTVGDGAYTAAGSAITKDVPAGALGVARARQKNVDGYADRVGDDAPAS